MKLFRKLKNKITWKFFNYYINENGIIHRRFFDLNEPFTLDKVYDTNIELGLMEECANEIKEKRC